MIPLPVTIISGYLGAGKTTLINRILGEDHQMRLMIIVNDFGAINIDAELLESAEEDTIALTNGCVCCTLGDDLNRALDNALDREPRPEHVIIEASGIADPAEIANAVIAEPELSYAGIITLVDSQNLDRQLEDATIAGQVTQQIKTADLVLATKSTEVPEALNALSARNAQTVPDAPLMPMLADITPMPKGRSSAPHPAYTTWQFEDSTPISRAALGEKLEHRPAGLYRLKGHILTDDGGYEVHIVGNYVSARRVPTEETRIVALGPKKSVSHDDIAAWWTS